MTDDVSGNTSRERARVVALGGGHGLAASLAAWRQVVTDLTGVVTVADNGGSSGRLREEFGVLPPGDLRMALGALCGDHDLGRAWAGVLQHRFGGDGELQGHAMGNLLIVGLWEQLGDPVQGLEWVARLLGAEGHVLPMALVPLDIAARVRGLDAAQPERVTELRGQAQVAATSGSVLSVALDPPEAPACPEAVKAVAGADLVVLGPGSWYTSVLPHVLVPELRRALVTTSARVVVVLNLAAQQGETSGYGPEDHLAALASHAPDLRVDTVLADTGSIADADALTAAVSATGARLVTEHVAAEDGTPRHDPARLAGAYARLLQD